MKILAAIVTHNRCNLLQRCLNHVEAQTRKPEGVLVVNNASTDGTEAMLMVRGIRFISQDNVGSAGGWHRCIEVALEEDYDAVWLMDDDGYPHSQALETLVKAWLPGVACMSSVVLKEKDPKAFVFPFPVLDAEGQPVLLGYPRKLQYVQELEPLVKEGVYPFAHFFNGALINLAAVRQVGNVDRDFFMFGDEVDYFFRLRRYGPVYSNLNALHMHPDVSQRPYTPAKVYYYTKNTLVINRRYFKWPLLRHGLAVVAVLARTSKRNGITVAISYVFGKGAPAFYSAIVRGLAGKLGKDFDD